MTRATPNHGSRAGRRRRQRPRQAGQAGGRVWPPASAASRARRTPCWLSTRTRRGASTLATAGLRPRGRPGGPLLEGATRGAGLQGGPPMGPPGPPARQLGAVVLGHRDPGGRRRVPHRLIQRGRRDTMEPADALRDLCQPRRPCTACPPRSATLALSCSRCAAPTLASRTSSTSLPSPPPPPGASSPTASVPSPPCDHSTPTQEAA